MTADRPHSPPRSAIGCAVLGAVLLVVVAFRFRLDRTLCEAWPSYATGALYGAIYLAAIGLLTFAWRRGVPSWTVFAAHAIALLALPFLSSDPLMYAAVGRGLSLGASTDTNVTTALGAAHPFLAPLVPAWRQGTGAYGPLWNVLASILGGIAGDDLALALKLHQVLALVSLLVGAAIVSRTKEHFALVALAPLAIIEATVGAHNDALLVPFVALAVILRARPLVSLVVLLSAALAKASALVYAAPVAGALVLYVLPARLRRVALLSVIPLAIGALVVMSRLHNGPLDALARIVGTPDVAYDHCTRSLECLPRTLFRFVLHMPYAAWVTGLVFRAIGAAWLAYTALCAAECAPDERLGWIARGLFVYFLLLHGWAQSWYLLPLVVALPALQDDRRTAPALRVYLVTAVAYYALVLPMSCLQNPILVAVSDLAEALVTVAPPVFVLWRTR